MDNKTEKPLLFSTKTENRMLKNEKSANRNEHQNRKTEVFWHKNRKTDLKNCQNRKTENPNVPLLTTSASAAFALWEQKTLAFDCTFQCCSFKKGMARNLDRD